jgi:hypothetical protein
MPFQFLDPKDELYCPYCQMPMFCHQEPKQCKEPILCDLYDKKITNQNVLFFHSSSKYSMRWKIDSIRTFQSMLWSFRIQIPDSDRGIAYENVQKIINWI